MEKNKSIIEQDLPPEIWSHILSYCRTTRELLVLSQVSKQTKGAVSHIIGDSFHNKIESTLKQYECASKLRNNRGNREFDPHISKNYFICPETRLLWLLGIMCFYIDPSYTNGDNIHTAWKAEESAHPIHVAIRCPRLIGRYFPTSVMRFVAGYLIMFDLADADQFNEVLYWINYIIIEKNVSAEHPTHFILVGVELPDKKRKISDVQAKYFAHMMGVHYIEVNSDETNFLKYLDPVYRFTTELFKNPTITSEPQQPITKDKKKLNKCKVQ